MRKLPNPPPTVKKARAPLWHTKFSTWQRATRRHGSSAWKPRHTARARGGLHWCGCVPSNVAFDVVAKRVCPA